MKPQHILAVDANSLTIDQAPSEERAAVYPSSCYQMNNRDLVVLQRDRAEVDWNYRHLIPYTVVMNKQGQVLVYKRGSEVGEQRLAGQQSIGFGGHIDLADIRYHDSVINLDRTIEESSYRELQEELAIFKHDLSVQTKGYILDNSNSVGRVHLGILQVATYSGRYQTVRIQEDELELVDWMKPGEIEVPALEPWSQAVLGWLCSEDPPLETVDLTSPFIYDLSELEMSSVGVRFLPPQRPSLLQRMRNWAGL